MNSIQFQCRFCEKEVEKYTQCIRPPPFVFCDYVCKDNYRNMYGEYKRRIEWDQPYDSEEKKRMNNVLREMQEQTKCGECGGGILCCKNWVTLHTPGDNWDEVLPVCSSQCYKKFYKIEEPFLFK
jgi:hypothetical protein